MNSLVENLHTSYDRGLDDVQAQLDLYENWNTYVEDIIQQAGWLGPAKTVACTVHHYDKDVEIADLACGPGTGGALLQLSGFNNVDGYDISEPFLQSAAPYYRSVAHCDITKTPFPKKYDVILASGVFTKGHLGSKPAEHLANSLTDDGVLFMTVPCMDDYDYLQESGWNDNEYLEIAYEFPRFKSLVTEGRQHYHRIVGWKRK